MSTKNQYGTFRRVEDFDRKEMVRLKRLGKSLEEIGDKLGFCVTTVGKHLKKVKDYQDYNDTKSIRVNRRNLLIDAMVKLGWSEGKISKKLRQGKGYIRKTHNTHEKTALEKMVRFIDRLPFPEDRQKELFDLFIDVLEDLQKRDVLLNIKIGAFLWWYTDVVALTNINISDIEREIKSMENEEINKVFVRGCSRVVKSKARALKKVLENGKLDIDSAKESVLTMLQTDRLKKEIGMDILEEILSIDDKDIIINKLDECAVEISREVGRPDYKVRMRMTRIRRNIEVVIKSKEMNFLCDERDLNAYIRLQIENIIDNEIIPWYLREILEKTAFIIANEIDEKMLGGMSLRGLSSGVVYLSLMYNGIRLPLHKMSSITFISESTVGHSLKVLKEVIGIEHNVHSSEIIAISEKGDTIMDNFEKCDLKRRTIFEIIKKEY